VSPIEGAVGGDYSSKVTELLGERSPMLRVRDVFLVFVCVAALDGIARADMMPVSPAGVECRQPQDVHTTDQARTAEPSSYFDYTSIMDPDVGTIQFVPAAGDNFKQTSETQPPAILTDGQSSLSLCLSALVGLGLCSSAHCLKKLHLGHIPEWYHHGGPSQIGHSFAVNPDSVCPAPACCFVQPAHTPEDPMPISRLRDIVSLWRQSQYTPDLIASRGPPITC